MHACISLLKKECQQDLVMESARDLVGPGSGFRRQSGVELKNNAWPRPPQDFCRLGSGCAATELFCLSQVLH